MKRREFLCGASAIAIASGLGLSLPKDFSLPVMANAQRDAMLSPNVGSLQYNRDIELVEFWDGRSWREVQE